MLDLTKDMGQWQAKSRVGGGRTENFLQPVFPEVKKINDQVGGVDKETSL